MMEKLNRFKSLEVNGRKLNLYQVKQLNLKDSDVHRISAKPLTETLIGRM